MLARRVGGDDRSGAARGEILAERAGIVGHVADHAALWREPGNEIVSSRDVGDVAWGQQEVDKPPLTVGYGVDLGRSAAARTADRLRLGPPFPPAAARCTLMDVLSMERTSFGMTATKVAKISCQRPRPLQRLKRL